MKYNMASMFAKAQNVHDWEGNSRAVRWLRLCASTAGDVRSVLGWGIKIPHAAWYGQTKRRKKKNENELAFPNLKSIISLSPALDKVPDIQKWTDPSFMQKFMSAEEKSHTETPWQQRNRSVYSRSLRAWVANAPEIFLAKHWISN